MYYVICTNEDGEVSMTVLDRDTLLAHLKESYWGKLPVRKLGPGNYDLDADAGVVIIAGESVVPRPKEIVTEWDI